MFASREVEQLSERGDDYQDVVIGIAGEEVIDDPQQCAYLAQHSRHYVTLLDQFHLLRLNRSVEEIS